MNHLKVNYFIFNKLFLLVSRHQLIEKYPKLKWCLLDSTVYNLANFNHPGGNFIIDEIKGKLLKIKI